MADIHDLIDAAINKTPVEFGDAFDDIMRQRSMDAIAARKVELAQSVYGTSEEDADEDLDSDEFSDEDFDEEDFDLDDDFDLEDEDLDEEDFDDEEES